MYRIADKLMEYVFIPLGISRQPVFLVLILCYFECILVGLAQYGMLV